MKLSFRKFALSFCALLSMNSLMANASSLTPYGRTEQCYSADDIGAKAYILANPVAEVTDGKLSLSVDAMWLSCEADEQEGMAWKFGSMTGETKLLVSHWAGIFDTREYRSAFDSKSAFANSKVSIPMESVFSMHELVGSDGAEVTKEFHLMLESDASQNLPSPGRYLLRLSVNPSSHAAQVVQFKREY